MKLVKIEKTPKYFVDVTRELQKIDRCVLSHVYTLT